MSEFKIDTSRYKWGIYALFISKMYAISVKARKIEVLYGQQTFFDKIKVLMRLERECPDICDIRKIVKSDMDYVVYVLAKSGATLSPYNNTCTLELERNHELYSLTSSFLSKVDFLLTAKRKRVLCKKEFKKAITNLITKQEEL